MLGLINRYLQGFVSVPINLACKKKELFELLEHHRELTLEQIVEFLGANGGHLQVALRMMQSINWLERNEIGQYYLTDEAQLHKKISEEILDLYHLPLYLYIKGEQQLGLLKDWIERSPLISPGSGLGALMFLLARLMFLVLLLFLPLLYHNFFAIFMGCLVLPFLIRQQSHMIGQ
ncbi:MAG: hypothetical protein V7L26_21895 [Nostoc sp.]|uniref:hypothetical protein n=1 Tax=Nostoc sp. TaxID=1180 RepID=UPI002FF7875C